MQNHSWTRRGFLGATIAAGMAPRRLWAAEEQSFSNATLVMPDGRTLNGGIRIQDGVIQAVGAGISGGTDLEGKWIVPGFTDAGCRLGLLEVGLESGTHDTSANQSIALNARAIDGYNPRSDLIPVARVNGITQVLVNPKNSGMIPGQAALVRTAGTRLHDVILDQPVGLCMNLGRAGQGQDGPGSRIELMMEWRTFFEDHPKPGEDKKKKKGGNGSKGDGEIAKDLRAGKLLALVRANRADDIERALDMIVDNELNAAIVGGIEGHLVADHIAAAGVPVLLGPLDAQPSSFQHPHARYENPAILDAAGIKLAFRSGDAHQVRNLPTLAGVAVAHGLPWESAIRALTTNPMDIFGRPELGRLAVGCEATFFVAEGDPLQPRHQVYDVYVQGQRTDMQTRQTRLFDAFKELE